MNPRDKTNLNSGKMAQNGVSNGSSNGNGAKNGQTIDEGLYSRQLFVLGKCGLTRMFRTTTT